MGDDDGENDENNEYDANDENDENDEIFGLTVSKCRPLRYPKFAKMCVRRDAVTRDLLYPT